MRAIKNIFIFCLILILSSCQSTSPVIERCLASSENSSCTQSLTPVKLLNGGSKKPSFRLGHLGNSGGAYRATIEVDGKPVDVIETSIYVNRELNYNLDQIKESLDLSLQAYELAATKNVGPKVYGYRDVTDKFLVIRRFIYLEPKGNILNFLPDIEIQPDPNTLIYWRRLLEPATAQKLLGKFFKPSPEKVDELLSFMLGKEEANRLLSLVKELEFLHPDPNPTNVILEFQLTSPTSLSARPWLVDWDNPNANLSFRKYIIDRLKKH